MPSRRNSFDDRKRRREEAEHRAANRSMRSPQEQFALLERAPGRSLKEMRKLSDSSDTAVARYLHPDTPPHPALSHMPEPPHDVSG